MPVDRSRVPPVLDDPPFVFPAIVHQTLACGLRVRIVHQPGAPVVTFVLVVESGAGMDRAGREGLAALTADMLDEGTGPLSALDVSDSLARLGADYDLDIGPDATIVTLTTLARFAPRAGPLLASIVTRPSLRAGDFDRVRKLRLDRLRQLKDLPPALAERAFLRAIYGNHPYGHLSIGHEDSLRTLVLEDVESFHRAAYRPSRATLVVAGGLSPEEAARVIEDAFGAWSERPADNVTLGTPGAVAPPSSPVRLAVVPRERAAQSELRIGRLSAQRSTPDYFPLIVTNAVIGGQFTSRINLKLREEKGYTYGARTGFEWRRGAAPFAVQTSVHTAATADAIADTLAELGAIRGSRPPGDEELTVAKASLTRGYPRNFETVSQVARSVAQLALFDLPDSYFETFSGNVHRVTGGDVVGAAQRYLDPGRMAVVVVGDYAAVGGSLGRLGLGDAEIITA
jgi:predicted Zn-dependent peptidase